MYVVALMPLNISWNYSQRLRSNIRGIEKSRIESEAEKRDRIRKVKKTRDRTDRNRTSTVESDPSRE